MPTDPKPPSEAELREKGLARLQENLQRGGTIRHCPDQRIAHRAERAAWCRLWQEGDTYESFQARHPERTVVATISKVYHLKQYIPKMLMLGKTHWPPYAVAQAFLASLPRGYRGNTEP